MGNPRYWDVQVSPIFGDDGKPSHLLSISRDITEEWNALAALKEASERQSFLTQELEHRIKNTLATVSAIANQTMQGEEYAIVRAAFSARMVTLSRAHDILTKTTWSGAPIKEVIDAALAPHRTGQKRIHLDGPELDLLPKQALGLALAVHELATNALKYGALSTKGTVNIRWSNAGADHPGFRFTWKEQGGPPVSEPDPAKKGFGSRLIERMLANDFDGNVKMTYPVDGIECELISATPIQSI